MAKKVGKLLAQRMLEDRSHLYRWLYDNRAEIEPIISAKPAWQALAKTAAESGVRTSTGDLPSRQAVRKAWMRLQADTQSVSKTETRKSASGSRAGHAASSPASTATPTASTSEEPNPPTYQDPAADSGSRSRSRFKPVSLKGVKSSKE
jgi:hypothetical protein